MTTLDAAHAQLDIHGHYDPHATAAWDAAIDAAGVEGDA